MHNYAYAYALCIREYTFIMGVYLAA